MFRILLIISLLGGSAVQGQQTGNEYSGMAETMVGMMDAMAKAYNRRDRDAPPAWGSEPWSAMPGGGMPGTAMPGATMPGTTMLGGMMPGATMPNLGAPTPLGQIPWMAQSAPQWPQSQPQRPQAPPPSPLDGTWLDSSGEVLVIRRGRFRIYVTPENYREGYLWRENDKIIMQDPHTGHSMEYEYAQQEHKLALRGPQGSLLLYQRLVKD